MEKIYIVSRIEGEYAYLREESSDEELFISLMLLPLGVDIGTKLRYDFPDFTVI